MKMSAYDVLSEAQGLIGSTNDPERKIFILGNTGCGIGGCVQFDSDEPPLLVMLHSRQVALGVDEQSAIGWLNPQKCLNLTAGIANSDVRDRQTANSCSTTTARHSPVRGDWSGPQLCQQLLDFPPKTEVGFTVETKDGIKAGRYTGRFGDPGRAIWLGWLGQILWGN